MSTGPWTKAFSGSFAPADAIPQTTAGALVHEVMLGSLRVEGRFYESDYGGTGSSAGEALEVGSEFTSIQGTLPTATQDFYKLTVGALEEIEIDMSGPDGVDWDLWLQNFDGDIYDYSTGSGTSEIVSWINPDPYPVDIWVRITAALSGHAEPYILTINRYAPPPNVDYDIPVAQHEVAEGWELHVGFTYQLYEAYVTPDAAWPELVTAYAVPTGVRGVNSFAPILEAPAEYQIPVAFKDRSFFYPSLTTTYSETVETRVCTTFNPQFSTVYDIQSITRARTVFSPTIDHSFSFTVVNRARSGGVPTVDVAFAVPTAAVTRGTMAPSLATTVAVPTGGRTVVGFAPSVGVTWSVPVPTWANGLVWSEAFDNWEKIQIGVGLLPVVTPDYGVAPDGTLTADRVVLNTGGGTTTSDRSRIQQQFTQYDTKPWTVSYWIKTTDGSAKNLFIGNYNSPSQINVTGEWTRYQFTTTPAGPWTNSSVYISSLGGVTADVIDLLVWGGQLNDGSVMRDYAPTSGSAVMISARRPAAPALDAGFGLTTTNRGRSAFSPTLEVTWVTSTVNRTAVAFAPSVTTSYAVAASTRAATAFAPELTRAYEIPTSAVVRSSHAPSLTTAFAVTTHAVSVNDADPSVVPTYGVPTTGVVVSGHTPGALSGDTYEIAAVAAVVNRHVPGLATEIELPGDTTGVAGNVVVLDRGYAGQVRSLLAAAVAPLLIMSTVFDVPASAAEVESTQPVVAVTLPINAVGENTTGYDPTITSSFSIASVAHQINSHAPALTSTFGIATGARTAFGYAPNLSRLIQGVSQTSISVDATNIGQRGVSATSEQTIVVNAIVDGYMVAVGRSVVEQRINAVTVGRYTPTGVNARSSVVVLTSAEMTSRHGVSGEIDHFTASVVAITSTRHGVVGHNNVAVPVISDTRGVSVETGITTATFKVTCSTIGQLGVATTSDSRVVVICTTTGNVEYRLDGGDPVIVDPRTYDVIVDARTYHLIADAREFVDVIVDARIYDVVVASRITDVVADERDTLEEL